MNITETIIQQIDIIDFIGKHTNLHQSGRYWKGKCPLHESDDTSETLVVFPDTNSFYCFSCECGGTVINFLSDKVKEKCESYLKRVGYNMNLEVLIFSNEHGELGRIKKFYE